MLSRLGTLSQKLKLSPAIKEVRHKISAGSIGPATLVNFMVMLGERHANQIPIKHRSAECESSMTPATLSLSLAPVLVL